MLTFIQECDSLLFVLTYFSLPFPCFLSRWAHGSCQNLSSCEAVQKGASQGWLCRLCEPAPPEPPPELASPGDEGTVTGGKDKEKAGKVKGGKEKGGKEKGGRRSSVGSSKQNAQSEVSEKAAKSRPCGQEGKMAKGAAKEKDAKLLTEQQELLREKRRLQSQIRRAKQRQKRQEEQRASTEEMKKVVAAERKDSAEERSLDPFFSSTPWNFDPSDFQADLLGEQSDLQGQVAAQDHPEFVKVVNFDSEMGAPWAPGVPSLSPDPSLSPWHTHTGLSNIADANGKSAVGDSLAIPMGSSRKTSTEGHEEEMPGLSPRMFLNFAGEDTALADDQMAPADHVKEGMESMDKGVPSSTLPAEPAKEAELEVKISERVDAKDDRPQGEPVETSATPPDRTPSGIDQISEEMEEPASHTATSGQPSQETALTGITGSPQQHTPDLSPHPFNKSPGMDNPQADVADQAPETHDPTLLGQHLSPLGSSQEGRECTVSPTASQGADVDMTTSLEKEHSPMAAEAEAEQVAEDYQAKCIGGEDSTAEDTHEVRTRVSVDSQEANNDCSAVTGADTQPLGVESTEVHALPGVAIPDQAERIAEQHRASPTLQNVSQSSPTTSFEDTRLNTVDRSCTDHEAMDSDCVDGLVVSRIASGPSPEIEHPTLSKSSQSDARSDTRNDRDTTSGAGPDQISPGRLPQSSRCDTLVEHERTTGVDDSGDHARPSENDKECKTATPQTASSDSASSDRVVDSAITKSVLTLLDSRAVLATPPQNPLLPSCVTETQSYLTDSGLQSAQEASVQQTSVEHTPIQQTSVQQTVTWQASAEHTTVQSATTQETPVQQTVAQHTPIQPTFAEHTSIQQAHVQQTVAQHTPIQPTFAEHTSIQQAHVQQTVAQHTPIQPTFAEHTSIQQAHVQQTIAQPTSVQPLAIEETSAERGSVQPASTPSRTSPETLPCPGTVQQSTPAAPQEDLTGKSLVPPTAEDPTNQPLSTPVAERPSDKSSVPLPEATSTPLSWPHSHEPSLYRDLSKGKRRDSSIASRR